MLSINQNKDAKAMKTTVLNGLCMIIDIKKKENNGCIPFGFVATLVKSHTVVLPWLTRDTIIYADSIICTISINPLLY